MRARRGLPAFVSLCMVAGLCGRAGDAGAQGSVEDDRTALASLHDATGGTGWAYSTNWLTEAPLGDWYGIETDGDGRVVAVSLPRNGLSGEIPSALGDLDRLEELWLTANDLTGAIPSELGDLDHLEVLSLAANGLTGGIPAALDDLTGLEQLNLNDNALNGSLPDTIGDLANLVDLSLDDNALSGSIPTSIGSLTGLRWLNLARNGLSGAVPDELEGLTRLEALYLDGNAGLSGALPAGLMLLADLGSVNIRGTGLCAPEDAAFRAWVAAVDFQGCGEPAPPPSPGGGGGGGGGGAGGGGGGAGGGGGGAGGEGGGGGGGDTPPPSRGAGVGPPSADFELDGAACGEELCRALTGRPVSFRDTSTGRVASRLWDFGDGTTSGSAAPAHAWSSPGFYEVTLAVSDGSTTSTKSRKFLVEASEPGGTCVADAGTLCLQDSRYAVRVEWWTTDGTSGPGRVAHEGTNDSGLFWFFDRNNWEVLVKVLDGCALNGHVWVFGASTTDLGYSIRVTDTVTETVKEYRNEPGMAASAITDARAFGPCARDAP